MREIRRARIRSAERENVRSTYNNKERPTEFLTQNTRRANTTRTSQTNTIAFHPHLGDERIFVLLYYIYIDICLYLALLRNRHTHGAPCTLVYSAWCVATLRPSSGDHIRASIFLFLRRRVFVKRKRIWDGRPQSQSQQ